MDIAKIDDNFLFDLVNNEFKYLKLSINMLLNNYKSDLEKNEKEFEKIKNKMKKDNSFDKVVEDEFNSLPDLTYGILMTAYFSPPSNDLQSFSGIIIESLLVKHLAFVEKLIVNLSFIVQQNEKQLLPPNYNVNGTFTDMIKAVEYINLITDKTLNIKDIKNWNIIILLRELRHNLAHGNKFFYLTQGKINEIKKVMNLIRIHSVKKENEQNPTKNIIMCDINSDMEVLKIINYLCSDFILNIENKYIEKYKK